LRAKISILPVTAGFSVLLFATLLSGSVFVRHSQEQKSQMRGVAPQQDAKAQVAAELKGHFFALVIGINNYQHLPKLGTAVQDAQTLASILRDSIERHARPDYEGDERLPS
jgi:hypothetical protein